MTEQEEFEFRLRLEKERAAKSPAVQQAVQQSPVRLDAIEPPNMIERGLAKLPSLPPSVEGVLRNIAYGAASPSVAAAQTAAHTFDNMRRDSNILPPKKDVQPIAPAMDEAIAAKDAEYREGLPGYAVEGARIAGTMMSPASIAAMKYTPILKGAKGVDKVVQYLANLGIGTGTGAAFGSLTPVTSGDYEDKKMEQKLLGAAGGAIASGVVAPAISGAAKGIGATWDAVRGKSANIRAGEVMRAVAGDKTDDIINAMAGKGDDLTAAQAAEQAGSTRWSALGERAAAAKSQYFDDLQRAQEAGRRGTLASVKPDLSAAETARATATRPMYNAARGQTSNIDTSAIVSNIDDLLAKNPGNDELVVALNSVRKGLVDASGNVRTNAAQVASVIDGVKAKIANKDNKFILEQLIGVKEGLKKAIPGMEAADAKFRELSAPVNQSRVIGALEDTLTNYKGGERVGPFLNVLGRGEKALLKKSTGQPRYEVGDMKKILTPDQGGAVDKVTAELLRDERLAQLATAGRADTANVLNSEAANFRLPTLLNRYMAITNKGLDVAEQVLNQKKMDLVYEAMKSGKSATEALQAFPTSERNKIIQAIIQSRGGTPYLVPFGANTAATQGE